MYHLAKKLHMNIEAEKRVVVIKEDVFHYPQSPYHPPAKYTELESLPYPIQVNPANMVYRMVRKSFHLAGLDDSNYGSSSWNPLSSIVNKGQTVVIKPNLVRHVHPAGEENVISSITHSSILRPIVDYTIMALKGEGRIVICDAPLQSADFEKACARSGLDKLMEFYRSAQLPAALLISLLDLRKEALVYLGKYHTRVERIPLAGDPLGYTIINLGKDSYHSEIDEHWRKYAITGYDCKHLRGYHTKEKHCYFISNTVLQADAVISIPKLKTHKKAGMTVCLKNFIGINASKDFLPHHRKGAISDGGDEYPVSQAKLGLFRQVLGKLIIRIPWVRDAVVSARGKAVKGGSERSAGISEGNWQGNDTLWRTILDLNTIVKYADKKGKLNHLPQRKLFFVVDGIIGQEGEGPMTGDPKPCGVVLAGSNPCSVDYAAAKIMGLNCGKIKQVIKPFEPQSGRTYPLVEFATKAIRAVSNVDGWTKIDEMERDKSLKFAAPLGWKVLESESEQLE